MRALILQALLSCCLCSPLFSQATDPAATPAAVEPKPKWRYGPIDFGVLFDGYYSFENNHPITGKNNYRNFDIGADRFDVNMAKISLEHGAEPFGYRIDVGFGRGYDTLHASSNSEPDPFRNIPQLFVSWKPKQGHGFQADFGKYYTSAGAEGTETLGNFNYSRSLLFTNGPYFHFGLRTSIPVGKHFNGGVQVVQGWNNILDNNSGKTVGITANLTSAKVNWSNTYYFGPEKTDTTEGWRHFYDGILTYAPNDKLSTYINFDYGVDRNVGSGSNVFYGIAGAARYALSKHVFVAPRFEWYNDADGFITGTRQQLKEFTLTGEYRWMDNLSTRLEYRRDWSNQQVFDRGNERFSSDRQNTLLIGLIAYWGPKH